MGPFDTSKGPFLAATPLPSRTWLLYEARDLGITLDSTLTLRTHINNICRSGSLSLHELSKIRKFISQKDTGRVAHAFISL